MGDVDFIALQLPLIIFSKLMAAVLFLLGEVHLMDPFVKERLRILIIDEHALSREAFSLLLSRALPEAMVFEIPSVEESLMFGAGSVGLILFGLRPPYMTGLDTLLELRRRFPATPVVLLSDIVDAKVSVMARVRGASGLFNTSGDTEDLLAVIQYVLAGKSGFPRERRKLTRHVDFRLSPRQAEVFDLLRKGLSNKEIGVALNISDNTVRTYVSAIFNILGVRNRTEAVILGRDLMAALPLLSVPVLDWDGMGLLAGYL